MKQATLCALACLLLTGTPTEASSSVRPVSLGYVPTLKPVPAQVRRWNGTLDNVSQTSLRAVVTEEGVVKIRGKRQRKQVRHQRWLKGLGGDRLATLRASGYPSSRYYESTGNQVRELWTYPEEHAQYIFDGDALVRVQLH